MNDKMSGKNKAFAKLQILFAFSENQGLEKIKQKRQVVLTLP